MRYAHHEETGWEKNMNIKLKTALTRKAIFLAVALLATATMASAANYEFKVIRGPAHGDVQTIELVDASTGHQVVGAEIEVVHTVYLEHHKGGLNIQRIFVPLQDHLSGKCTHPQSEPPASREVTVVAKVPGEFWSVWGTVDLSD
jgi:hypothetical protein